MSETSPSNVQERNLVKDFTENLKTKKYSGIFLSLKKFFALINAMEDKNNSGELKDFLVVFNINFDDLIEPEREKRSQMRGVLQTYLQKTFNPNIAKQEDETEGNLPPNQEGEILNTIEQKLEEIKPTKLNEQYDAKKNDFMQQKIVDLIRSQLNLLHIILFDEVIDDKELIKNILIKLYDRFQLEAEQSLPKIFNYFIKKKENIEIGSQLIDKIIDIAPQSSLKTIFNWLNTIKEHLLDKENIPYVEKVFSLLKTYSKIYPDYVVNFLPDIILLIIGSKSHNLLKAEDTVISDFSQIIEYYAKRGEDLIAKYALQLYDLCFDLSGNVQRNILVGLKHVFENYPDEIASRIEFEHSEQKFYNQTLNLLKANKNQQINDLLIDNYILVKILMQKLRIVNQYKSEISKLRSELPKDENVGIDPDTAEPKIEAKNDNNEYYIDVEDDFNLIYDKTPNLIVKIINSYITAVQELIPMIKDVSNSTYLLFKSVTEIDSIIHDMQKSSEPIERIQYSKQYLNEENIKNEKDIKKILEILTNFLRDLKHNISSIN